MVISECIWQGWKVDECEEGIFPSAVYIMLAGYMAGAVLKAIWETTDISCSRQFVRLFSVNVRLVLCYIYV